MYSFKRPVHLSDVKSGEGAGSLFLRGGGGGAGPRTSPAKRSNCIGLLSANQVVRALPPTRVPLKEIFPKGQRFESLG